MIKSTIDLSGPFFAADFGRVYGKNVERMMEAFAREGEADVRNTLRAGEAGRAPIRQLGDHTSAHAVGRVESLSGKHWHAFAVVSVNNSGFSAKQGISLMAAASRVEGVTHAFRRTAGRLRKARALNAAELIKDLT